MRDNRFLNYIIVVLLLMIGVVQASEGTKEVNSDQASLQGLQDPPLVCTDVITRLPFVELFSIESPTVHCWRIVNNNHDDARWNIPYNTSSTTNIRATMPIRITDASPDDWLISPRIRVNGHQRVRFTYHMSTTVENYLHNRTMCNMEILVSKLGSIHDNFLIEEFVYEVTPILYYGDLIAGSYLEVIYDLVDQRTQLPISGDINIAFHLTSWLSGDDTLYLDNVIVEDIPTPGAINPPVGLPYATDFEEETPFNFMNDVTNTWAIGSAVNNGGDQALYITNDGGVTNDYTLNQTESSHAFIDFNLPASRDEIHVEFDLRSIGFDFEHWNTFNKTGFLVRLLDATTNQPVATIPYEHYNQNRGNGWDEFNSPIFRDNQLLEEPAEFRRIHLTIPWSNTALHNPLRGGIARLDFEFVSGQDEEKRIAIAIDNLSIYQTCDIDLESREVNPNAPQPRLDVNNIATTTTSIAIQDVLIETSEDTTRSLVSWWYDIILSTVPLENPEDHPLTLESVYMGRMFNDLDPWIRDYYIYYRPKCLELDGTSTYGDWYSQKVRKPQNPAELTFLEGFEDFYYTDHWDISSSTGDGNGNALNKWHVGEAVSLTGDKALYISDDLGENYHYTTMMPNTNTSSITRKLIIQDDAVELYVSYNYQIEGEFREGLARDYFNNSLKFQVSETAWRQYSIGQFYYVESDGWQREVIVTDLMERMPEGITDFIFTWNNDEQNGVQPPAAIDNLKIMESNCKRPLELEANLIEGTQNIELTWDPQGDETQWEVFIVEQGGVMPEPEDRGILVEDTPSYLINNVEEGVYFHFYVRAVCGETQYEHSFWEGPGNYFYSIDTPCVASSKEPIDVLMNDAGDYIICDDSSFTVDLKVAFGDSRETSDYYPKAIDYAPIYPFVDQGRTEITGDDMWSAAIDLGFDFCFYNQTYNKVLLSTNGVMSFSIEGETAVGQYTPNETSSGVLEKELIDGTVEDAPFVAAIYGAMQNLDLANSPADASVNYKVYGEFPCRVFVFNIYHVALAGEAYNPLAIEETTQTSQIVLYESTSTIEVNVKKRPTAGTSNEDNNSKGVIGIINHDGSKAKTPFQRNTGRWRATEEAWRFVPNGEYLADLQWYKGDVAYAKTPSITVKIDDEVKYTAKITYQLCDGNELVLEESYNFIKEDFDVSAIPDFKVCSNKTGQINVATVDVEDYVASIMDHINDSITDYTVIFYEAADLGDVVAEPFQFRGKKTIYVEVTSTLSGCKRVGPVSFVQLDPVIIATLPPVEICKEYILPKVEEGAAFYTKPFGEGERYETGQAYNQLGQSELYVYKKTAAGCEGQSVFSLLIHEEAIATQIENQELSCETFVLPPLPKYNRYFTRPHGKGIELQAGMEIVTPMEIFIYAKNGSERVLCIDESRFTVNYDECPLPKGISPNGDGLNDALDLSSHGITQIKIFNREGVEVYSHGRGYKKQWYGQNSSGKMLPSGTYFYVLTSHGKQRTGWIQLIY
ncbi:gliding motility-associated C-terminal domain-containing protein [Myroides sp. C15-4]|uniref:T9SS type B sorting domain-containing protein n=1 Tax=Myroides sp. C15-4 TaxID=3400532 RepID=UPI003D2F93AB